ncbi:MAG: L,D-transpeptidase, partial [Beijerinckiaceae bacterium]
MNKQRVSLGGIDGKIRVGAAVFAALAAWAAAGEARAREFVAFPPTYPAGTIIIKQSERRLYFTTGSGTAVRYPIAIGRAGRAWRGETYVDGKFVSPAWSAPAVVLRDHPALSRGIPGGGPPPPPGGAARPPKSFEHAQPRPSP